MFEILRALTRLFHVWWTKDRIRVARGEGKLLRVHVGDRLLIGDRVFRVVARQDNLGAEVASVVYTLAEEQTGAEDWSFLQYSMQQDFACLSQQTESLEIPCDQVVVLESKGSEM